MSFETQPRRSGKSALMRQMLDAAIERGEKIALCSVTPDGESHVCHVQHIKTARKK